MMRKKFCRGRLVTFCSKIPVTAKQGAAPEAPKYLKIMVQVPRHAAIKDDPYGP